MAYVALRRMKIGDGYREIGEPVPEAGAWPDVGTWIAGGYIAGAADTAPLPDGPPAPDDDEEEPVSEADLILVVANALVERTLSDGIGDDDRADLNAAMAELRHVVATINGSPEDPVEPGDQKPVNGAEPNPSETVPRPEPKQPIAPSGQDMDLAKRTRKDLNAHAAGIGIEAPEAFANKAELIAAIAAEGGR